MPNFVYEALNEAGQPHKGEIAASSREEARARIRSKGYFPTSVRERKTRKPRKSEAAATQAHSGGSSQKKWSDVSLSIGGVSTKALTTITRQLSTLQDAGLPILRSVSVLEQQQKPCRLKNILKEVHDDVSGGSSLSDAMAKHPKAFDKLYTKMIAAGEVGGVLDQILNRLADFMEKSARLKRRIIGAMIYPAVVLSVASIILLGIMIFIVPTFEKIFSDFDAKLPELTVNLISASKWLGGALYPDQALPGVIYVLASPFLVFFGLKLARKTTVGRRVLDRMMLMVPVAGQLVSKSTIARFARTLGTLINAGVPILDAILITRDTTGNFVYQDALQKIHDSVRQGDSFVEPLRRTRVCDAIVCNMVDVGEETGELDKMLLKVADNYDEEVDTLVNSLVSLLEPLMVIFLGGSVGFIVVALFLPLVSLIQSVQGGG